MKIGDNVVLRGTIKGVTYEEYGFPHYLVTLPNGCETEFPKPYIENLQQLDKPEKVKVPQFVANWYEKNKDDFEFNVWDWIAFRNEPEKLENKEFNDWINDGEGTPIQILVNMHQFGYEVEKRSGIWFLCQIRATTKATLRYCVRKIIIFFGVVSGIRLELNSHTEI